MDSMGRDRRHLGRSEVENTEKASGKVNKKWRGASNDQGQELRGGADE
jgi:hypothetical protein